jgi:hypothetical protein
MSGVCILAGVAWVACQEVSAMAASAELSKLCCSCRCAKVQVLLEHAVDVNVWSHYAC